jgi:hypothetical protein
MSPTRLSTPVSRRLGRLSLATLVLPPRQPDIIMAQLSCLRSDLKMSLSSQYLLVDLCVPVESCLIHGTLLALSLIQPLDLTATLGMLSTVWH